MRIKVFFYLLFSDSKNKIKQKLNFYSKTYKNITNLFYNFSLKFCYNKKLKNLSSIYSNYIKILINFLSFSISKKK